MKPVILLTLAALVIAAAASASIAWHEVTGDVVILGEYHDNPLHHQRQRDAVIEINPKAVVFEMLTGEEAIALAKVPRSQEAMEAATEGFHWSNIRDYAGVLSKSENIIGAALPREQMRTAFEQGAAAVFGPKADTYGLTQALPEAEQTARQEAQFNAHCQAMPLEMMTGMVAAQRLRDAHFARTVIAALDTYGSPIILITGNGHARNDWGVPIYLKRVRPDLTVFSYGQGENDISPPGTYDALIPDAPAPDRADPCAAFN